MVHDGNCIFCKIVAGESPCSKVYEDDFVVCFMDIYPASRGHVLIATKEHFDDVVAISDGPIRAVGSATRKMARAINQTLAPDGISVVQANGTAAGQTVIHYHVHVLPRTTGVKLRLHGPRQAQKAELDEVSADLAGALDSD